MLDQLQAERLEADAMRKINYSEKDWIANLLRPDSGANLTEKHVFAKSVEDPFLLRFHRSEAAMPSPRCGYDNLTTRMALAKRSPEIREVHRKAGEILAKWKQEGEQKAA
jgi:hypothetical protein